MYTVFLFFFSWEMKNLCLMNNFLSFCKEISLWWENCYRIIVSFFMIDGGYEKIQIEFPYIKVLKLQNVSTLFILQKPSHICSHFLQSYYNSLFFYPVLCFIYCQRKKEAVLNVMIGRFKEILFFIINTLLYVFFCYFLYLYTCAV